MMTNSQDQCTLDIACAEKDEIRERIACALATKYSSITVDSCDRSPSRLTLRCRGGAGGKRFFAKLFLTKTYPIPQRFPAPWDEGQDGNIETQAVCDQIEMEWEKSHRMRELSKGVTVPAPLGKSREAQAIVWEEIPGIRLDHLAAWSPWTLHAEGAGARALFRAGQWLRGVHDASARGCELIDLAQATRWLTHTYAQEREEARKHLATGIRILRGLTDRLGERHVSLPVAFTHGDFCLTNILWHKDLRVLTVVDFEMAGDRPTLCDLFAIVSNLRAQLLNPLIARRTIEVWEASFWRGYGDLLPEYSLIVRSLALARIYYHHLPRLLTRGERRGRVAGLNARLYRAFLERFVTAQRFGFPQELKVTDSSVRRTLARGAAWMEAHQK